MNINELTSTNHNNKIEFIMLLKFGFILPTDYTPYLIDHNLYNTYSLHRMNYWSNKTIYLVGIYN